MNFKPGIIILSLILTLIAASCNYSFTGASISPEAKTVSVGFIKNMAPLVNPTLSQSMTDALKDKLTGQTNLFLKDKNGDLQFEGEITDYSTQPIAIQAGAENRDKAALNRLTITVKIRYSNKFDEKAAFETTFSRFEDYDSQKNLRDVEDGLVKNISDALVEDIFNKAVVNW